MANAYIEICTLIDMQRGTIAGPCQVSEVLAISGTTATSTAVVTAAIASAGGVLLRVTTDDTACYLATGTTPDPTLTAPTAASGARQYVGAGQTEYFAISQGGKVAVKAVA